MKKKGTKVYSVNKKSKHDKAFDTQVRIARTHPFSPFAQYCIDLKGFDLYYEAAKIAKYQAWELGYRDAEKIKAGLTNILLKNKPIHENVKESY